MVGCSIPPCCSGLGASTPGWRVVGFHDTNSAAGPALVAPPVTPASSDGGEEWISLPGRSPVPPMVRKRRRRRAVGADAQGPRLRKPELTIERVIHWADRYHEGTGRWPNMESGRIEEAPGES